MEKMDRGEVRKLLAEGKTPQEVAAIFEARQTAATSAPATPIEPTSPTALYGTPTSASSAPDVAPAIAAEPDKEKHELNKDSLLTYIREYSTGAEGVILDQGVFASQFNISIAAAQRIVNTLVKKGVLNNEHKVIIAGLVTGDISEAEIAEAVKEPVVAVITPEVAPKAPEKKYGFTNRELLEFLKTKAGTNFSDSTLLENFNLSKEHAAEVIRDLKQARIIGDDNKVMDGATLDRAEKDFEGHPTETLDDEYTFVPAEESAAFSVPTIAKTSTPVAPPPEVSTVKPTAAAPVDLDFDLNEHAPAVAPTPDAVPAMSAAPVALTADPLAGVAPGAPDSEPADPEDRNTFLSGLGDKAKAIISWVKIPPSMKNSRAYAVAAVIALAGGGFAAYNLTHKEEQAKPAAEKTEPKPDASKPAPAKQGGATPEQKEKKDLNSTELTPKSGYEKSKWWIELDPEVKESMQSLLNAKEAQTWALKFFDRIEVEGEKERMQLTPEDQLFIYNRLTGSPVIINLAYSENRGIVGECRVQKENKTCYARENLANMVIELRKIFRAVDYLNADDILKELLEPKTIPQTFTWAQQRAIKIINENAN